MPVFTYKGVDAASKNVSGVIDAESEKAARAKLRKMRVFPTKVALEGGSSKKSSKFFQTVTVEEIASMTRQLAVLINASIPLIDALSATLDQVENPIIRTAMTEIKDKVTEGARLGDCMAAYPKVFDNIYIFMVKAGEASGALDVVLQRLADFKEAQAEMKAKIKSAMTYPVIMAIVATGMLGYIFTGVVPKITAVFQKQKAVLPMPTQIIIQITYVIQNYWWLVAIIGVGLFFAFRSYARSKNGRARIDDLKLKIPVFGDLNRKVAVARFSRTLSTLLNSGVQLLQGLDIVRNVMDNVVLSKVIEATMVSVKEGESLADPLRRSGRFPTLFIHMVTVGEKTGQLEQMLQKVADTFDTEVDHSIDAMTALLTPVMLVVMGGAIGFIVFAVMMPILQLTQNQ